MPQWTDRREYGPTDQPQDSSLLMAERCVRYRDIATHRINNKAYHSLDGEEGYGIPPTHDPDHSFIPTTQATESGAIDLISRWALEKPAALTVATMA